MRDWRARKPSGARRWLVRAATGREERARSAARVDWVVGLGGRRVLLKSDIMDYLKGPGSRCTV